MAVLPKVTYRRPSYLNGHKTDRGVYNDTGGGMSISLTCESPSAH